MLVSPRNPLNIGAAARAMSNFGFFELRLVNPYEVAFREARPASERELCCRRRASFAPSAKPWQTARSWWELRRWGGASFTIPCAARIRIPAPARASGVAAGGAAVRVREIRRWLIRIPAREEHGSMNLGQAAAVYLYELIRSAKPAKPEPHGPGRDVPARDAEVWMGMLRQILPVLHAQSVACGGSPAVSVSAVL